MEERRDGGGTHYLAFEGVLDWREDVVHGYYFDGAEMVGLVGLRSRQLLKVVFAGQVSLGWEWWIWGSACRFLDAWGFYATMLSICCFWVNRSTVDSVYWCF